MILKISLNGGSIFNSAYVMYIRTNILSVLIISTKLKTFKKLPNIESNLGKSFKARITNEQLIRLLHNDPPLGADMLKQYLLNSTI